MKCTRSRACCNILKKKNAPVCSSHAFNSFFTKKKRRIHGFCTLTSPEQRKNAYDCLSMHNSHPDPGPKSDKTEFLGYKNGQCPTILLSSFLSFPSTQTSPRITRRWLSSIASSGVVSISTRTTGVVGCLHRAVILRWRAGRWRRGVPAWWELLLLLLLLLAVCMLCCGWLAIVLLSRRR